MRTPGIYIAETNAFPPSVVPVETSVPAFVGYTEKAAFNGKTLKNLPFKVTSMAAFEMAFGGPWVPHFTLAGPGAQPPVPGTGPQRAWPVMLSGGALRVVRSDPQNRQYLLYHAMRMFFENGGGSCWIVSVGNYEDDVIALGDAQSGLKGGIEALKDQPEPTLLLIPDAVRLEQDDCISLQQAMLHHCGHDMKSRFAILDIHDGDQAPQPDDPVAAFRNSLGEANLGFGAAYYPWLNTVVVQDGDITYRNFIDDSSPAARAVSVDALLAALAPATGGANSAAWLGMQVDDLNSANAKTTVENFLKADVPKQLTDKQKAAIAQVNQYLVQAASNFTPLRKEAIRQLNVLPPSGAIAGLYTVVDNSRGVWKAPANVRVNGALSPTVPISDQLQQDLNVTPMGKSVNAIRSFAGQGVLLWGARTLSGNSMDWRYINVRRTMIFLEQSLSRAIKHMVFEPNVSRTWVTIKAMIENFLTTVWRQGGLAGTVPQHAFSVHVGLGETMTADDMMEGILRVTVLVAITRPAEFIAITFEQQMPKS